MMDNAPTSGLVESPRVGARRSGRHLRAPDVSSDDTSAGAELGRAAALVRELRSRYLRERQQMSREVEDHAREATLEAMRAEHAHADCARRVDGLVARLNFAEAHNNAPVAEDLRGATDAARERLERVLEEQRACNEEVQLLKAALVDDRLRREARAREMGAEDEALQLRLSELEDQNEFLRCELQRVRAAGVLPIEEALRTVLAVTGGDSVGARSIDDGGARAARVIEDRLRDLRDVQLRVEGRLESVARFCQHAEGQREAEVEALTRKIAQLDDTHQRVLKMRDGHHTPSPPTEGERGCSAAAATPPPVTFHAAMPPVAPTAASSASEGRFGTLAAAPAPTAALLHVGPPSLRERLVEFYETYNPAKVANIDRILAEYDGAEFELFSALEAHYGAFGYFAPR